MAFFFLLGLFGATFLIPYSWVDAVPLCLFHYLSHVDCPGCGLTRAFLCISQGRWIEALQLNALSFVVYLLLLFYLLKSFAELFSLSWSRHFQNNIFRNKFVSAAFLFLFLGQWLLKLLKQLPTVF